MMFNTDLKLFKFCTVCCLLFLSCEVATHEEPKETFIPISIPVSNELHVTINRNVPVEDYFNYIDSIVQKYDSIVPYELTEHVLVHANSWIIDSLANTDYYRMMAKDSFVYNQRKMIVLVKGIDLHIPDSLDAKKLISDLNKTIIDINIPAYKLRIYQDSLLYTFPVRVGRNETKYLKMGDRDTNLKTRTGTGLIVSHVKDPDYYNPVNGRQYYATTRDDKRVTKMPQIPWLETELNGVRYGQLIHPTTNPKTLGKAYSNGCIGTSEAAAWVIYYFAPIGTRISVRYDLQEVTEHGETIILKDIYK